MKKTDKTQLLLENKSLFNAAVNEFSSNSYKMASTNEIIKNCDLNKGSFYYRFSNKEEIFVALMDYIIVTQVDLYNQRNNDFSEILKIDKLIYELFFNLRELYLEDKRFYSLITRHLYDDESKHIINEKCIKPLKYRVYDRLETYKELDNFQFIMLIVDNLYHNFPEKILNSDEFTRESQDLINFVISDQRFVSKPVMQKKSLRDYNFENRVNYLLVQKGIKPISEEQTKFSDLMQNPNKAIKALKRQAGTLSNNYKKILKKVFQRSLKDMSHLQPLLNKDIEDTASNNDSFNQFLLISLYLALKEEENVIFDYVLEEFSVEEIELILLHILPSISKTSKIMVLENKYFFSESITEILLVDLLGNIHPIKMDEFREVINKVNLVYIDKDGKKHEELLSMDEFHKAFKDLFSTTKIVDMKMIKYIDCSQAMKRVDKI
jgi:AcrR family transcriptional regulator